MLVYDVSNKSVEMDSVSVSLYRRHHYSEYLEKFQEIYSLISRESVYSGKYDEYVNSNFTESERYSTEVDDFFLQQINGWRLEIGRYLYEKHDGYKDVDVLNGVVYFYGYVKIETCRCI